MPRLRWRVTGGVAYGTGTAAADSSNRTFDPLRPVAQSSVQWGYQGNDSLYGYCSSNILHGGQGDDYLYMENSCRGIAYGGVGNDWLSGDAFSDCLYGGAGNDTLQGYGSDDCLTGGANADIMWGGPGDDTLFAYEDIADGEAGVAAADTVNAGPGNDEIHGGGGGMWGYGGTGADRFFSRNADGVYGGEGDDFFEFAAVGRQAGFFRAHGGNNDDEFRLVRADDNNNFRADARLYGDAGDDEFTVQQGGDVSIIGGLGEDDTIIYDGRERDPDIHIYISSPGESTPRNPDHIEWEGLGGLILLHLNPRGFGVQSFYLIRGEEWSDAGAVYVDVDSIDIYSAPFTVASRITISDNVSIALAAWDL